MRLRLSWASHPRRWVWGCALQWGLRLRPGRPEPRVLRARASPALCSGLRFLPLQTKTHCTEQEFITWKEEKTRLPWAVLRRLRVGWAKRTRTLRSEEWTQRQTPSTEAGPISERREAMGVPVSLRPHTTERTGVTDSQGMEGGQLPKSVPRKWGERHCPDTP